MMVPDHRAGTRLRCPRCGVELQVPGTAVQAASAQEKKLPAEKELAVKQMLAAAEVAVPDPGEATSAVQAPPLKVPDTAPVGEAPTVEAPPLPARSAAAKAWIPPRIQRATAVGLSLVLAALALFGVAPAVWEWFALWQNPDEPPVPPWVFALLITAVLQLGYAVYLWQAPDWSAMWATTIATLAAAAAWAALLGTTLLGQQESALVELFRYADKLEGNRAAMWCFIMLCFTSVLAYFLGLTAVRWKRAFELLRKVHAE